LAILKISEGNFLRRVCVPTSSGFIECNVFSLNEILVKKQIFVKNRWAKKFVKSVSSYNQPATKIPADFFCGDSLQ